MLSLTWFEGERGEINRLSPVGVGVDLAGETFVEMRVRHKRGVFHGDRRKVLAG